VRLRCGDIYSVKKLNIPTVGNVQLAALEELLAKKRAMQSEELLRLFTNSNRTYDEVAAFLKEGMT
jgi:hypothetical protein